MATVGWVSDSVTHRFYIKGWTKATAYNQNCLSLRFIGRLSK